MRCASVGLSTSRARGRQKAIDEWLADNRRRFQVAYVARPSVGARWIPSLRRLTSARIIYSPVDLHFLRERRRYELTGADDARADAERLETEETATTSSRRCRSRGEHARAGASLSAWLPTLPSGPYPSSSGVIL